MCTTTAISFTLGSATKYCTAKLPPKQPMATGEEGKYRYIFLNYFIN